MPQNEHKKVLRQLSEAYQSIQEGLPGVTGAAQQNVDPGIENDSLLSRYERESLRLGEQLPELPIVNSEEEAFEALKSTGITGENNAVKWITRVLMYNNLEVPTPSVIKASLPGGSLNLINRSLATAEDRSSFSKFLSR